MTGEPSLTVTSTADWPLVGFVHSGMKVRTIFANTMADLERRLVSVCIAEFGMGSDDSAAFAAASVATPAQQFAALQAQFDDTVAKFAAAESHVALLQDELTSLGVAVPTPPSPQASDMDVLAQLWAGAGLRDIATRGITVQRTYASFGDYWATVQGAPSMGAKLAALSAELTATLKARLQARLVANAAGEITCAARANAIFGTV